MMLCHEMTASSSNRKLCSVSFQGGWFYRDINMKGTLVGKCLGKTMTMSSGRDKVT